MFSMTVRQKGFLFLGVFFTIFLLIIVFTLVSDHKEAELGDKKYNEYVGKVQFKGKVVNSRIFKYGGKPYLMVCVQLDYSNYKEYYVLNDYCFLRIKNNIATMAVGFFNSDNGIPKYVEVNIKNNRIEKFTQADGTIDTVGLNLANYGLTRDDMNTCN